LITRPLDHAMRTRTLVIFAVGCVVGSLLSYFAAETRGKQHTLATVLRKRGVTPETITHFRFIGDEHSYTSGRVATDTNATWIWDRMIQTAEPYSFWEASGNRRVEVYTRGGQQPAAVLLVNATDATSVAGDDRRFMCHGLHDLAMRLLSPTQTAQTQ
jgi:hypothetical protein